MRRIFIFLLLTGVGIASLSAVGLAPDDRKLCDSVMQIAARLPKDTTRIAYLRNVFSEHKSEDWTIGLLHSAEQLTHELNTPDLTLKVMYDISLYYDFREDIPRMRTLLSRLREISFRQKEFYYYFSAWYNLLINESSVGNIESVKLETARMKREADSLNYFKGITLAELAIGESLNHAMMYDEALKHNQRLLEQLPLTPRQRVAVYRRMYVAYMHQDKSEKALAALDGALKELNKVEVKDSIVYKSAFMDIQLEFCQFYLANPGTKEMKKHMDEATRCYSDELSVLQKINYHSYLGGYYYLVNDMPNCYKEYDIAIDLGKDKQSTFMVSVHQLKAQSALYRGDYKMASYTFKDAVRLLHHLNVGIANNKREAIRSSQRIRKALLDNEAEKMYLNIVRISAVACLLFILTVLLIHIIRTNKVLRLSEKEIREAWKRVDDANRMKEIFLHNIQNEIKEPIRKVVDCAEVLSRSDDLSQENRLAYSGQIKRHAGWLIQLVNNVLDLSRLEAGMMKFNVQECDLVLLCREAKVRLEMQEENPWRYKFSTGTDELMARVDAAWFSRVLLFLLSAPEECREMRKVEYAFSVVDGCAHIDFRLPAEKLQADSTNERIGRDIVRLYLETAGGSCTMEAGDVVIVCPALTAD